MEENQWDMAIPAYKLESIGKEFIGDCVGLYVIKSMESNRLES